MWRRRKILGHDGRRRRRTSSLFWFLNFFSDDFGVNRFQKSGVKEVFPR